MLYPFITIMVPYETLIAWLLIGLVSAYLHPAMPALWRRWQSKHSKILPWIILVFALLVCIFAPLVLLEALYCRMFKRGVWQNDDNRPDE